MLVDQLGSWITKLKGSDLLREQADESGNRVDANSGETFFIVFDDADLECVLMCKQEIGWVFWLQVHADGRHLKQKCRGSCQATSAHVPFGA